MQLPLQHEAAGNGQICSLGSLQTYRDRSVLIRDPAIVGVEEQSCTAHRLTEFKEVKHEIQAACREAVDATWGRGRTQCVIAQTRIGRHAKSGLEESKRRERRGRGSSREENEQRQTTSLTATRG
eukprot:755733-Hanusia_phi.AAC.5